MSYREELEQGQPGMLSSDRPSSGAPLGARQNVRADGLQGAPSRPGGATQNSGGAIEGNAEGSGDELTRGSD